MLGLCCCMGFSLVESRGYSLAAVHRLLTAVASPAVEHRLLGMRASTVAARGLSSCGTGAELLHGMCDPPGPGIEPMSPALADRFFTTSATREALHVITILILFFISNFIL